MVHTIKINPEYYYRVKTGQKQFEIRNTTDRDFQVGDEIRFHHYNPKNPSEAIVYEILYARIIYVLHGPKYGISEGYCVFGFEKQ